jgi:hypothetical protein
MGTAGRNRPGLFVVPRGGAGDVNSVGAWRVKLCVAMRSVGSFPRNTCGCGRGRSCRSARPTVPEPRRRQGGGAGAARSCAGQRPGPCGFARGAGQGWMGVGNERHAFASAEDLAPAASRPFPTGIGFWQPWKTFISSLRRDAGRFLVVALPRLCLQPPGHFGVTGLSRRLARCITFCAASLSIFGATPAHPCCRV